MRKIIKEYWLMILSVIIIIGVSTSSIMITKGTSMRPSHGSLGIIVANPLFVKIERFDVVLIQGSAIANGNRIYKRVIGLPGEHVEISYGEIKINGKILDNKYTNWDILNKFMLDYEVYLKDNEYVVLGDNQPHSGDTFSYRKTVLRKHIKSKEIFYIKIIE